MIQIKQLSKSFSTKKVLENVNLTINDGTIMGLVGINGAGKSTLLRLISGVYKQEKGEIIIDNETVFDNEKIKEKIFFLPDEPYYERNTTPASLYELYSTFYKINKAEYWEYLNKFNLPYNSPIHNFSKGMKRQVFVSLAIAIKPKYLLLDEAFDGLDPLARLTFKKALIDFVEDKKSSVIISSHSLRELEDICDYYALIDNQTIASTGEIIEKIEQIHKYQVAFEKEVKKEDFNIDFIKYEQDKRIVKVVCKEPLEEFNKKISNLNPLIIDEIPIDFEELFIIEVESRGYLKWKEHLITFSKKDY